MPEARIHGGAGPAELQACERLGVELLDLSVNVNPYGPPPELVRAVNAAPLDRYPDPTSTAARHALAERYGLAAEQVVVGPGAAPLLWTCVRALLRPGDVWTAVEPTFSEATAAAAQHGCVPRPWRTNESDAFELACDDLSRHIDVHEAKGIYLCTPNNPTGMHTPFARIRELAARHPHTWLLVDQSFLALSEAAAELEEKPPPNVVLVRSLTKELSIPGLRTGYLLAAPHVATRIEHARPAWSTSAGSQAAAEQSVALESFVARSRARMLEDRQRMEGVLHGAGLPTVATVAPYVMARVGHAAALRSRLLHEHGILIRDCASFGLPGFMRVCGLLHEHARRFERALSTVLEVDA